MENVTKWKAKCKKVSSSKRNLFSQQDSEAQFINLDEEDNYESSENNSNDENEY